MCKFCCYSKTYCVFHSTLSIDDDINDEEFYDDHLEAYFEQLAVPGMLYEAGGQESPENVFKLPVSDFSRVHLVSLVNYYLSC